MTTEENLGAEGERGGEERRGKSEKVVTKLKKPILNQPILDFSSVTTRTPWPCTRRPVSRLQLHMYRSSPCAYACATKYISPPPPPPTTPTPATDPCHERKRKANTHKERRAIRATIAEEPTMYKHRTTDEPYILPTPNQRTDQPTTCRHYPASPDAAGSAFLPPPFPVRRGSRARSQRGRSNAPFGAAAAAVTTSRPLSPHLRAACASVSAHSSPWSAPIRT